VANKNTLCTISLVFALLLFSLLPSVVSADAAFSSITITDAKPTELHPGDTREVVLTVKGNPQILIYQNCIIFQDFLRHRLTQINTDLK